MSFHIAPEDKDTFISGQMEYWRQVRESDCFDIGHISLPRGAPGLMIFDCMDENVNYPYCVMVERYARFGLHRYNMSEGTNFQFQHLQKYNMTMNCLASYYITFAALDPTTSLVINFQVRVRDNRRGRLNVTCFISRRQVLSTSAPLNLRGFNYEPVDVLPHWPSDFDDTNRFHEIKESELESNDWIRLYLELAICTDDRRIPEKDLSELHIIKVAIETSVETTKENETHPALNVYIVFKGLAVATIGEDGAHVVRRVIVRRIIHDGYITFLGGYGFSIGEVVPKARYTERPIPIPRPRPRPRLPGDPPRPTFTPFQLGASRLAFLKDELSRS